MPQFLSSTLFLKNTTVTPSQLEIRNVPVREVTTTRRLQEQQRKMEKQNNAQRQVGDGSHFPCRNHVQSFILVSLTYRLAGL